MSTYENETGPTVSQSGPEPPDIPATDHSEMEAVAQTVVGELTAPSVGQTDEEKECRAACQRMLAGLGGKVPTVVSGIITTNPVQVHFGTVVQSPIQRMAEARGLIYDRKSALYRGANFIEAGATNNKFFITSDGDGRDEVLGKDYSIIELSRMALAQGYGDYLSIRRTRPVRVRTQTTPAKFTSTPLLPSISVAMVTSEPDQEEATDEIPRSIEKPLIMLPAVEGAKELSLSTIPDSGMMDKYALLPSAMQNLDHWVVRGGVRDDGTPDKTPLQINGFPAKVSDNSTWTSFERAIAACASGRFDCPGFVFTQGTGIIGIDIDDARDENGEWKEEVRNILALFSDTYSEESLSGNGLHIYAYGTLPKGTRRRGKFEIYDDARYFAVTGNRLLGASSILIHAQNEIDLFYTRYIEPPNTSSTAMSDSPSTRHELEDAQVVQMLRSSRQGTKFIALYEQGDISAFDGDESRADYALCQMLRFGTGNDAQQMKRLMLSSALKRPKWGEARGDGTILSNLIAKVIESGGAVYTPRHSIAGVDFEPESPDQGDANNPTPESREDDGVRLESIKDMLNKPRLKWRIQDFLIQGSTSLLTAPHASFKSFLVLDMALCVATGREWHGHKVEAGPVIYIAAEGSDGLVKRVLVWLEHHGIQEYPKNFFAISKAMALAEPDTVRKLVGRLQGIRPALIVVDTLARNAVGLDENSARDMGQFVAGFERLSRQTGAHTLIVHHNNKTGGYRGSSVVPGAVDTCFSMVRKRNEVVLSTDKQKDAPEALPHTFRAQSVDVTDPRHPSERLYSIVLIRTDALANVRGPHITPLEEKTLINLIDAFGEQGATASEWVRSCKEEGVSTARPTRTREKLVEFEAVIAKDKDGNVVPRIKGLPRNQLDKLVYYPNLKSPWIEEMLRRHAKNGSGGMDAAGDNLGEDDTNE